MSFKIWMVIDNYDELDPIPELGLTSESLEVEFETAEAAEYYRTMMLEVFDLFARYTIVTYGGVYARVKELEEQLESAGDMLMGECL